MNRVESIFIENYKDLCVCAFYYLKDIHEAEDVVQDVFVKIIEQNKLKDIGNLKSYLRIAVRNASLKRNQKRKLEQGLPSHDLLYSESNTEVTETIALNNKIELYKQIDLLPKQCKKIFLLCVLDGLKYKEAAEVLGVSVNTVKTQMKKAFKTLRHSLKRIYLVLICGLIKKS